MFENQQQRIEYCKQLTIEGKQEIVALIEEEYYADRSQLLEWLDQKGYVVRVQPMDEIVHIVYAVPIKSTY
jgi:putative AdoMet-dependent methyltransferase